VALKVNGEIGNIGTNWSGVFEGILGNCCNECKRMVEDLSPGLNSRKVSLYSLAGGKVGWKLGYNCSHNLHTLEDIFIFEVCDGCRELFLKDWTVFEALVNFIEVIIFD
jgi:hypothetical protein